MLSDVTPFGHTTLLLFLSRWYGSRYHMRLAVSGDWPVICMGARLFMSEWGVVAYGAVKWGCPEASWHGLLAPKDGYIFFFLGSSYDTGPEHLLL